MAIYLYGVIVLLLATVVHCTDKEQNLLREIDEILTEMQASSEKREAPGDVTDVHRQSKRGMYKSKRDELSATEKMGADVGHELYAVRGVDTPKQHNTRGKHDDQCAEGYVRCGGVAKCIPVEYMCDGMKDCYADGWDEDHVNCGAVSCPQGMLKCNGTGRCITRHEMCNEVDDCGDLEDEHIDNCGVKHCDHSSTKCPGANFCLSNMYWCDGNVQCPGGQDEVIRQCQRVPCDGARCSDGRCISSDMFCDGLPHCLDGGDEDVDRCGTVRCPQGTERCGQANYCFEEPRWRTCDGHKDCPNGADEWPENCQPVEHEPQDWYFYERAPHNERTTELEGLLSRILKKLPQ